MTKTRLEEVARDALGFSLWLLGVTLNLASVIWLGLQGLSWLRDGHWTYQPTLMSLVANVCPGVCSFATNPHSWFGAAKLMRVLSEIPCGLALAGAGFACALLSVSVTNHRPEPPPVRKSRTAASF